MNAWLVFGVLAGYFGLLIIVSYFTSRRANTASFFNANKRSPWYLVAYGMIGASLSGVTFISVPGWVKDSQFSYFQMVLGYFVGYLAIMFILLPLYYKQNLVSIYKYLDNRFGKYSYKTGSAFFLLSRIIGAAFRLYLVAGVLQIAFFNHFSIPFWVTVIVTIILIWLYTFKAGIKTIVWTDTLQTTFMLLAVVATIWIVAKSLGLNAKELFTSIKNHPYSQIFFWDWHSPKFFWKQFWAGAFMAFVMTGLDQDMMQKNLTVRTLKGAQKNMFWFSLSLIPVNLLFLSLGVLLYMYAEANGIPLPARTDDLYPTLAINYFGLFAGIVFLIGITAAAFSSADSALTALTTAFALDFLGMDINRDDPKTKRTKTLVHLAISAALITVILVFNALNNKSVISQLFKVAGYTYGPLLGLFMFGILTQRKVKDKWVPLLAIMAPVIAYGLKVMIENFSGYKFGFEFLILNGLVMFIELYLFSRKKLVTLTQPVIADQNV